MATEHIRLGCPICAFTHFPSRLGLAEDGSYTPERAPLLQMYRYRYGGRARLTVTPEPMPLTFALGLRDALRTALARLEEEITESGAELPEE